MASGSPNTIGQHWLGYFFPCINKWVVDKERVCLSVIGRRSMCTRMCTYIFCSSTVQRELRARESPTPNPPGILGTFSLWFQVTTYTVRRDHSRTYARTLHSRVLYFYCLCRVGFVSFPSRLRGLLFFFSLPTSLHTQTIRSADHFQWILGFKTRRPLHNTLLWNNHIRIKFLLSRLESLDFGQQSTTICDVQCCFFLKKEINKEHKSRENSHDIG